MTDEPFLDRVADRLAALPGVRAVTLGGSRAQGTHTPESDWDRALYYRGDFYPDDLRAVGCRGGAGHGRHADALAVLAGRGVWVTNEKRLLERAGLRRVDAIVAGLGPEPAALAQAITEAESLFESEV